MLIDDLKKCIETYNTTDFASLSYRDFLHIEHCIEELSLTHEINKIKVKTEILKEQDFKRVFTLSQDNYKDLIEIKKLYKDKKGIYLLSFSNGRIYVGQTNNFCRRLDEYFDINNRTYIGHNEGIRDLFKEDRSVETTIYFLEANEDRNLLESTYIDKFKANDPRYGYNKTGGNE